MDKYEKEFCIRFAKRLKHLRNNEGMSQKEFSESCGIGSATYERFEQARSCPRISSCFLIAKHLHISLATLLSFQGNNDTMY